MCEVGVFSSLLMAYVQEMTVLYNRFITMISQAVEAVEAVLKMFLDLNVFFIQNY